MSFDQPKQEFGPINNVQSSSIEEKPKNNYRMIIITVGVLLLGLAGYFASKNENIQTVLKNKINFPGAPSKTRTGTKTGGVGNTGSPNTMVRNEGGTSVEIIPVTQKASYAVNENITLKVKGSSNGRDITGFDILVMFDKSVFDVVSTASLADGFTIFANNSRDHLTVTGIKDIGKQEDTVFNGNDLIQVVLKPKTSGTFKVEILENSGKEKTQLVDRDVNAYTPKLSEYTVTVQ